MITTVFIDLDGTLADSFPGISNGVMYALKGLSVEPPPVDTLTSFIGPPLFDEFSRRFGLDEGAAREAVRLYREYYSEKGIYEQTLIEGAEEMLRELKADGRRVCLATSKPQEYAEKILKFHKIANYFDGVYGASMDGRISRKHEVLASALEKTGAVPAECIMVGDRFHDVEGAHKCGVRCIGVLCGYGSAEELSGCGAELLTERLTYVPALLRKL